MSVYLPAWLIALAVGCVPFFVAWLVDKADDSIYFNGMQGALAFIFAAGVCWTGLLVWGVMSWLQ
jgi:hypothetical protein